MNKKMMLAGIALVSTLGCDYNKGTPAISPTTITPSTSSSLPAMTETDRALAEKVKSSLRQDPAIGSASQHIQVYANNGEITLQGSVNTQQEKTELENKAQKVVGVSRVNNQLIVTSASR